MSGTAVCFPLEGFYLIIRRTPRNRYHYPHFTNEEIQPQRGKVTFPSHTATKCSNWGLPEGTHDLSSITIKPNTIFPRLLKSIGLWANMEFWTSRINVQFSCRENTNYFLSVTWVEMSTQIMNSKDFSLHLENMLHYIASQLYFLLL